MKIPKPSFHSCDETSLSLKWDEIDCNLKEHQIKLQYKEPHQDWSNGKDITITTSTSLTLTDADVIGLNPGTPYCIRLMVINLSTNKAEYGPEIVFDTKPIDCGPKGKSSGCVIN